ncbi:hypothetical protein [Microbulbifer elongatus]|uniref:hypothetical protein n=1 Tax=Microbulbifer elongatus TaxID=86173 RepID=UPI001E3B7B5D|nr:hypothetical protein [Microbulbifer elongatus]
MSNNFEAFSGIPNALKTFSDKSLDFPHLRKQDNRTRQERREDFEEELGKIDRAFLEDIKNTVLNSQSKEELWSLKEEVENCLIKFSRYFDSFENFNAEETRKVELKKRELKLEARHDWSSKFRLFFFRVLASFLLIVTLFSIGYIEHEYEWARLPMSKYLKIAPSSQ